MRFFLSMIVFFGALNFCLSQAEMDSINLVLESDIPDTTRIKTLQNKAKMLASARDFSGAVVVAQEAEVIARKIEWAHGSLESYYQVGRLLSMLSILDTAIMYYDKGIALSEQLGNQKRLADNLYYKANAISNQDQYEKSIEIYERALEIYRDLKEERTLMRININLAWVYSEAGYFPKAAELLYESIRIAEKLEYDRSIFNAKHELGYVQMQMGNNDDALKTFEENVLLADKIGDPYKKSVAYGDMGLYHGQFENHELALSYDLKDLNIQIEMGETKDLPLIYNNIGANYLALNQNKKAIDYFNLSLESESQHRDFYNKVFALRQIGVAYSQMGNPNYADRNLKEALELSLKMKNPELIIDTRKAIITHAESYEDYKIAYDQTNALHVYQDSIINLKKIKQFNEIETKYETEKKEKAIIVLEKNAEISDIKQSRLLTGLLGSILLGIFAVFYFWNKRRKDRVIFDQEQLIEKQKRLNTELENAKLSQELDFKKQELAAKVLTLCKKNEFLLSLEKEVADMKDVDDGTVARSSRKISRLINRDLDSEDEWSEFLQSFTQVHSSFLKELQEKHEKLTKNELRLSCLLKMNLSSKDISNMLNISAEGIKKARYRLRKKLDLQSIDNLEKYLISI